MGVISDGNSYGVPDDLLYSFPVVIKVGRHGRRVHTRAHAHTHDIKYVWIYRAYMYMIFIEYI